MYGCWDPIVMFGVYEQSCEYVLSPAFLEDHNMEAYPHDVVREYAGNYVYGVICSMKEVRDGTCEKEDEVKRFALALKETFAKKDYGEPTFYLAIIGEYSNEQCEYDAGDDVEDEEPFKDVEDE